LREELGLETDILHPERVRQLWKFLGEKVAEQYPHLVAATPQEDIDDMQTSVDHPVPMAPLVPVQSTPSSSSRTCASTQDSAGELPMEVLENDPPASTTTQEEFDILEPTYLENIQEEVDQELQDAMIISNHPRLQSETAVAGSSSVSPKRKREQVQLQRSAGSEGKASPKKQANKAAFKSKTFGPAVRALTASHVPAMMTTGSIDHIGRDKQPRKRAKKGPNSKSPEVESTRDDRVTDSESNNALTAEDVSPSEQLLRALRLMKRANKSERTVRDTIGLDPDDFNKRIVHHREKFPHTQRKYKQADHIANAICQDRGQARLHPSKVNTYRIPDPAERKVPLDRGGRPKRTWRKVNEGGWKWVRKDGKAFTPTLLFHKFDSHTDEYLGCYTVKTMLAEEIEATRPSGGKSRTSACSNSRTAMPRKQTASTATPGRTTNVAHCGVNSTNTAKSRVSTLSSSKS
jgi:hypothetical protein